MAESTDQAYRRGFKDGAESVYIARMRDALEPLTLKAKALESDRAGAVSLLRSLCADYGDNDWPDDAPLAIVIAAHLGRLPGADGRGEPG